jgi:hypothetical protein
LDAGHFDYGFHNAILYFSQNDPKKQIAISPEFVKQFYGLGAPL